MCNHFLYTNYYCRLYSYYYNIGYVNLFTYFISFQSELEQNTSYVCVGNCRLRCRGWNYFVGIWIFQFKVEFYRENIYKIRKKKLREKFNLFRFYFCFVEYFEKIHNLIIGSLFNDEYIDIHIYANNTLQFIIHFHNNFNGFVISVFSCNCVEFVNATYLQIFTTQNI